MLGQERNAGVGGNGISVISGPEGNAARLLIERHCRRTGVNCARSFVYFSQSLSIHPPLSLPRLECSHTVDGKAELRPVFAVECNDLSNFWRESSTDAGSLGPCSHVYDEG